MRQIISIVTANSDGDEVIINFPARWEICPICDGCGTDRGASVECDGGGFTSSEWAEQDDDFKADYLAGHYDRPCHGCTEHAGRILVIDRDRASPDDIALYDDYLREEADFQSMCHAERMMGA